MVTIQFIFSCKCYYTILSSKWCWVIFWTKLDNWTENPIKYDYNKNVSYFDKNVVKNTCGTRFIWDRCMLRKNRKIVNGITKIQFKWFL